jgi:lactoylglutathione lyase
LRTRNEQRRSGTETLGLELAQDAPYGERWLEVRTPDKALTMVLDVRHGPRPVPPDPGMPTSNVMFYTEDLQQTHRELTARGVQFPVPPIEQSFGGWSVFEDADGNQFALMPPRD